MIAEFFNPKSYLRETGHEVFIESLYFCIFEEDCYVTPVIGTVYSSLAKQKWLAKQLYNFNKKVIR